MLRFSTFASKPTYEVPMSQQDKGRYYRSLKAAGVELEKHYRDYSVEDFKGIVAELPEDQKEMALGHLQIEEQQAAAAAQELEAHGIPRAPQEPVPVAPRDEREMPSQRLNTQAADQPLRTDQNGLIWYQEEVLKPAFPKPRGRRVLTYIERGTETVTAKSGEYVETFEVSGTGAGRPAEVKITMPSYQVGIYKDPRFPFKIHVYNGNQGFDLFEVNDYYGGAELVPSEVKRIYVENVLCYDIRTVVRAIQTEYRQLQLAGKV